MNNDKKIKAVSEQTGISVKELNRLNNDLWYHGTTIEDAESIKQKGVLANYNSGKSLDFGPGFYLTDTYQHATSYISKLPIVSPSGKLEQREEWAIIEFEFNPYEILFSELEQYNYCNFPTHNIDFAKFVFDNRAKNRIEVSHHYDLIWGVMSDSIPEQVIWDYKNGIISYEEAIEKFKKSNSMKQLFLSNQKLCNMLIINNIYYKEAKQYV